MENNKPEIIWETTDLLERKVVYDTWARAHILKDHSQQFDGDPDAAVKRAVETGQPIYKSRDFEDRELYFKMDGIEKYPGLYLTVVVEHNDDVGTVVTAFPTRKISGVDEGGLVHVDIKF